MPISNPSGYLFRTRELLVRQRTQLINALRGHLAEYGIVVAIGTRNVKVFQQALLDHGTRLPKTVLTISGVYFEQIAALTQKVTELEIALRRETARDGQATFLQTMPGIGPMSAAAIQAFAPPLKTLPVVGALRPDWAWFGANTRVEARTG